VMNLIYDMCCLTNCALQECRSEWHGFRSDSQVFRWL
jgi:hypothetical protein